MFILALTPIHSNRLYLFHIFSILFFLCTAVRSFDSKCTQSKFYIAQCLNRRISIGVCTFCCAHTYKAPADFYFVNVRDDLLNKIITKTSKIRREDKKMKSLRFAASNVCMCHCEFQFFSLN